MMESVIYVRLLLQLSISLMHAIIIFVNAVYTLVCMNNWLRHVPVVQYVIR